MHSLMIMNNSYIVYACNNNEGKNIISFCKEKKKPNNTDT